jgi:hypothetical protein
MAYVMLPSVYSALCQGYIEVGVMRSRTETPVFWLWRRTFHVATEPIWFYVNTASRAATFVAPVLLAVAFWLGALVLLPPNSARLKSVLSRLGLGLLLAGGSLLIFWCVHFFALSFVASAHRASGA